MLRIVASMAWADGSIAPEEVQVMVSRLSRLFAEDAEQQQHLQEELRNYLAQDVSIENLVAELDIPEREQVLKLSYEVIASSARTPDEATINEEEAAAYTRLVELLGLPEDVVRRLEAQAYNGT